MNRLRVKTPAKINLFLHVLGRRPDGYHELETLFQAVELFDELVIEAVSGESELEVPGFPELETEDNLVLKAVRELERITDRRLSVRVRLKKAIPIAGGLGGGSSDAAATLKGLDRLFGLGLDASDLRSAAVSLGADVPFFLTGGSAVGEGVGERLFPVRIPTDYEIALTAPGFPLSTRMVFEEFSASLTTEWRQARLWRILDKSCDVGDLLSNDLQTVAERLRPEISEVRQALRDEGAERVLMTGSGPSVFRILDRNDEKAVRLADRIGKRWPTIITRPWTGGIIID